MGTTIGKECISFRRSGEKTYRGTQGQMTFAVKNGVIHYAGSGKKVVGISVAGKLVAEKIPLSSSL